MVARLLSIGGHLLWAALFAGLGRVAYAKCDYPRTVWALYCEGVVQLGGPYANAEQRAAERARWPDRGEVVVWDLNSSDTAEDLDMEVDIGELELIDG